MLCDTEPKPYNKHISWKEEFYYNDDGYNNDFDMWYQEWLNDKFAEIIELEQLWANAPGSRDTKTPVGDTINAYTQEYEDFKKGHPDLY